MATERESTSQNSFIRVKVLPVKEILAATSRFPSAIVPITACELHCVCWLQHTLMLPLAKFPLLWSFQYEQLFCIWSKISTSVKAFPKTLQTCTMKKFFCCLRPVIHRHHLMSLNHLLWMIHQEDYQSRKIKMSLQGYLGHSAFSVKVATSWQPTWILSSVCVLTFTNFNFDVIVAFSATWLGFTKTDTHFLDIHLACVAFLWFDTNTHLPFDATSGFTCIHMSDFFELESSATCVSASSIYWKIKADLYKSK